MNTPRVELFPNIPSSNVQIPTILSTTSGSHIHQTGNDRSVYGSQFTVDSKLLITCTIFVVVPTGNILS